MLAGHVLAVPEKLAVLLTELPVREAGGQLPTWDQLEELKEAANQRGIPLHLDGAGLWECSAGYGWDYTEICGGFDSCYVSFYKGIGAMLLRSKGFIEEATVWQKRSGGNLFTLTANVASAAMQWEERLARPTTTRAAFVSRVFRSGPGSRTALTTRVDGYGREALDRILQGVSP